MNLTTYLPLAIRTEAHFSSVIDRLSADVRATSDESPERLVRMLHASMGLCTEVGELMERWDLSARNRGRLLSNDEGQANFLEEIGDASWYHSILLSTFGWSGTESRNGLTTSYTKIGVALRRLTIVSAQLLDASKKALFYGKAFNVLGINKQAKEIEECLESLATLCGTSLDTVRAANIAKLQKRYPAKFTAEAALTRDTTAEMDAHNAVTHDEEK